MERTITIQQIRDVAQEAYNLYKDNTEGKNADYIPYLANINPKLFGISICLMNGEKFNWVTINTNSALNLCLKY